MKQRNCRKTGEEKAMHEKAVRVRKMTDAQISDFISKTYQAGMEAGAELASAQTATSDGGAAAEKFLEFLEGRAGSGNRIGKGTILYEPYSLANRHISQLQSVFLSKSVFISRPDHTKPDMVKYITERFKCTDYRRIKFVVIGDRAKILAYQWIAELPAGGLR